MKSKLIELDVDFIGGLSPMTIEEEKSIREYLKAQKLLRVKKNIRASKTTQLKRVIA